MYGKPVLPNTGGQQSACPENTTLLLGLSASDSNDTNNLGTTEMGGGEAVERATPRPLSPTKLLPFLSNTHRKPSDADLEALRRRLHHAPRPLKKRSSITEPEGPAGPNIQKLLYQKTTLAAMETIPMETVVPVGPYDQALEGGPVGEDDNQQVSENPPEESLTPPPLPPRSPIPDPASYRPLPTPLEAKDEEEDKEPCSSSSAPPKYFTDEFPPYPPPPYPMGGDSGEQGEDAINLQPPEVTGQVALPPVSVT